MKKLTGICLAMGGILAAASASVVLVDYEFNDSDGTSLQNMVNSGTDPNTFGGAETDVYTTNLNGTGVAYFNAITPNKVDQSFTLDTTISSGTVTAEWRSVEFSFSGTSGKQDTGFGLSFGATSYYVELRYEGPDVKARLQGANAYKNSTILSGASSTNAPILFQMIADVDNTNLMARWKFESDSAWTTIRSISLDVITNGVTAVNVVGDTDEYGAGDFAEVDYFTVTGSIPEPATLGMLGLVGGAIFFIRRRFMI
jgi:hypothetical protein